jgi:hypothetical protein
MMSEPKPLASLSSGLLARKGQAKPAMRPQGFANFGMAAAVAPQFDDLGWNDMGHDVHPSHAPQQSAQPVPVSADIVPMQPPVAPEVVRQQVELEQQMAGSVSGSVAGPEAFAPLAMPTPPRVRKPRAAPGSKGKAAFTLRLDPERHLKLRLVCAFEHRSAQAVVVAALDAYLVEQPAAQFVTNSKPVEPR